MSNKAALRIGPVRTKAVPDTSEEFPQNIFMFLFGKAMFASQANRVTLGRSNLTLETLWSTGRGLMASPTRSRTVAKSEASDRSCKRDPTNAAICEFSFV